MKVNNIYTSIACNRTPESADWGNDNLIIFGACNSVAVFDPNVRKIGLHVGVVINLLIINSIHSIMSRLK